MCMGVLPRCMFVYHLRAVSIEGWSKLGLALQTVRSCHMGAENEIRVFLLAESFLLL